MADTQDVQYAADALINMVVGSVRGTSNFSAYNVSDDMPAQSTCDKCKRPRDNFHPTLCPICLIDGAKPSATVTYLPTPEEQDGQAERTTPA